MEGRRSKIRNFCGRLKSNAPLVAHKELFKKNQCYSNYCIIKINCHCKILCNHQTTTSSSPLTTPKTNQQLKQQISGMLTCRWDNVGYKKDNGDSHQTVRHTFLFPATATTDMFHCNLLNHTSRRPIWWPLDMQNITQHLQLIIILFIETLVDKKKP